MAGLPTMPQPQFIGWLHGHELRFVVPHQQIFNFAPLKIHPLRIRTATSKDTDIYTSPRPHIRREERNTAGNGVESGELKASHNMEMRKLPITERELHDINQNDVLILRPYLLHLKGKELGFLRCEQCDETESTFDFHHKRYGLDVTFKDLQLLCQPCHRRRPHLSPP